VDSWIASLIFDLASLHADEPAFLVRGSTWLIGTRLAAARRATVRRQRKRRGPASYAIGDRS
jgi:hypothetical protein